MTAPFPDHLRPPLDFDPARLAADMAYFSHTRWIEHFVKQKRSCVFGDRCGVVNDLVAALLAHGAGLGGLFA